MSIKKKFLEKQESVETEPNQLPSPDKVTVAEVNAEMSKEYGWLGNDIVGALKCILRELVRARLEREKGVK